MFFNSVAAFAPRESAAVRKSENDAGLRRALLVGTVLGAGALVALPGAARAQSFSDTITTPQTGSYFVGRLLSDTITVTTTEAGTFNTVGFAAIELSGENGSVSLTANGAVIGTEYGVSASATGSGAVTVQGSGSITGGIRPAIFAQSDSGAVTVSGSGATTSINVNAITASIENSSATADLLINRSGLINAGQTGVDAKNSGTGKITISGLGAITAGTTGILSSAGSGATLIDLNANVSGSDYGVSAKAGAGSIKVKTASGVTLSGNGPGGIGLSADSSGNIDLGDAAGLGGAVSGTSVGIYARTGEGTINIKSASGATVKGDTGVRVEAYLGDVNVDLGADVTGDAAAVDITSGPGAVTVKTASGVKLTASGNNSYGINVSLESGNIDIGGQAGLAGQYRDLHTASSPKPDTLEAPARSTSRPPRAPRWRAEALSMPPAMLAR